ncbi:hypothetical protein IFT90_11465 [Frigoribacterium sp. CFBP 8766]|uniref:hypothetical protein n=1 Tax=Frigoribacterium sp. CFBP 8766 TaxID=2775273 RepID=UPI00177C082C|nr:hypothetical protein [Frigoribacterium sp. CFBP 8766]MBD8585170.1 hypothetical protein [Frigoribacterium sp. CFBP 8766]
MTDANTPRDRADEGDARDRAPREPARDPLDDAPLTRDDHDPDADAGDRRAADGPAVDFVAPAADRPAVDFGAPSDGPAEPAVAPEDRVEDSGAGDRYDAADRRVDDTSTTSPDSSTGPAAPPAVAFGDAPADRTSDTGSADVDRSGDDDVRGGTGASAAPAATTTPESSTGDERLPGSDERASSDHADTEVLHDRVEPAPRDDADLRDDDRADRRDDVDRQRDADRANDPDRADDAHRADDADRRDDEARVVPPVVAPTPPASRAWSASPQDDSGRPLHDDDALRAAEAHRAPGDDGSRVDGDAENDGDRRDDSPTVVAPVAAPGRGDDAPTSSWRTDDGRVAGRPGGAGPATGSQAYPLVAETADPVALRRELLTEQKQEFSGIRFGAGLLGWLAATGFGVSVFVVFAAIASAVVAASSGSSSGGFRGYLGENAEVLSITTGIVVLVIVFAGYFVGGFTASRVARFSGFKQGLATWLWGLVITIVVGVVGAVVGVQAGDQSAPNPMIPSLDDMSSTSVESFVFLGLLVVLSFAGAVLGGLLGQRWHRKVDRFVPDHQV